MRQLQWTCSPTPLVVVAVLMLGTIAPAQRTERAREGDPWRFGVLFWHESPNDAAALTGIRAALQDYGAEHELDVRQAGGDRARAVALLDEFVATPVDLVFAMGTEAALLCAGRVRDVPVVFTAVTNPVESGVVPSWEGSGANLCGNSNWIAPETVLRVFRRAVPDLRRLGMLRSTRTGVVSGAELRGVRRHLEGAVDAADIEIVEAVVDESDQLAAAVDRLVAQRVQAIWVPIDLMVYDNLDLVLDAVRASRTPLVSSSLKGTRTGAVAGIVVDYEMLGERAVALAFDVLERGRDPGALPVGTMQGYRVVVNLGAARAIGYELPLSLLVLADEIHEELEGERR